MIYKNGKLVTSINQNITDLINNVSKNIKKLIGKVYYGSLLIWITIYNAIRSCFGSGIWYSDRDWLNDDNWKNN